jgi:DNA (cytosine-5)-methyltransferase 1
MNTITCERINTKKSNSGDLNYASLTDDIASQYMKHISLGGKLLFSYTQYENIEDKRIDKPTYRVTFEVTGMKKLGLRTKTEKGLKYLRYKLHKKNIKIDRLRGDLITFGFFSNGMGSNQTAIKELNLNHKFNYSFEIDKFAQQTLSNNFNIEKQYGDLFTADARKLPQTDVLTAGFPCQTWSKAGKQQGFNDRRGTIIFKLKELFLELNELNKAPKVIFLENVENIISHDKQSGKFDSIYSEKSFNKKIGHSMYVIETEVFKPLSKYYDIVWGLENTIDYGIPHNRPRWFCVMTLKTSKYNFSFEKLRNKRTPLTTCLNDYLDDISEVEQKYFYTANKMIKKEYKNSGSLIRVGEIENVTFSQSKRVLSSKGAASCFTCGENSKYLIGKDIRTLTVSEKLKLQGFPKWFEFNPKTSDTQRHKQLGNTMTINIVKSIFSVLFDKENYKIPSINSSKVVNNASYQLEEVA